MQIWNEIAVKLPSIEGFVDVREELDFLDNIQTINENQQLVLELALSKARAILLKAESVEKAGGEAGLLPLIQEYHNSLFGRN